MPQDYYRLIKNFDTSDELNKFVTGEMILEFQKPGLILLSAGDTYKKGVYDHVNKYYEEDQNKSKIHPQLSLSHVDELMPSPGGRVKESFGQMLKESLHNVTEHIGDRFYVMDVNNPVDFDKFIRLKGAPRLIYLGLGADPDRAHVAYIGEDYINTTTAIVELGPHEKLKWGIQQALTIGTDIFKFPSLESIRVLVKGKHKTKSLETAFTDPDTGLGFLIKHHNEKLKIYCDHESASVLK